jgi:uncharacterized protein (DUF1786 family)
MKFMKNRALAHVLFAQAAMFLIANSVFAQAHSAAEIKKDAERHKAMAAVHTSAAQCLESGKKYDICMKDLQVACKGLGIGKQCGMRHEH